MLCYAAHRCTKGWYFKSKRCQRCDADVLSPGALAAVGIAAGAVVVLVAFKLFLRHVETLLQQNTQCGRSHLKRGHRSPLGPL